MSKGAKQGDRRAPRNGAGHVRGPGLAMKGTVRWAGPLFTPTGYGDEARGFVKALRQLDFPMKAEPLGTDVPFARSVAEDDPEFFKDAVASMSLEDRAPTIAIAHLAATAQFLPRSGVHYNIARTMWETDSYPATGLGYINTMDEVWVPSTFNAETFRSAGVNVPMRVIGEGVDTRRFRPGV